MVSEDEVTTMVMALPDVTVGTSYGNKAWSVGKKHFAWMRPFSKADLKRFGEEVPPKGSILAVRVADLLEKDAAIAANPKSFFTIPHFEGYAAVLIQLEKATKKQVKQALGDAYLTVQGAR